MKLSKRFLAMAIAAFMLLAMMPAMSAMATVPTTGTHLALSGAAQKALPWTPDENQTVVVHYSFVSQYGNGGKTVPSGLSLLSNTSNCTLLVGTTDSKILVHSDNGSFVEPTAKVSFDSVLGEKVYATVLITRYADKTEMIYMVNGVEAYRTEVAGAYVGAGTWTHIGTYAPLNALDYVSGTPSTVYESSYLYGISGALDESGKAALMNTYTANVSVKEEVTDVTVSGTGVLSDGTPLSGFKIDIANETTTVAQLREKLNIPDGVALAVYANADATEPLADTAVVATGAVLKTTSSNGFTKLSYAITAEEPVDPMNMTWESSGAGEAVFNKAFGREQIDGETVLIRYKYNAYGANEAGTQLSGIMLNTTGEWGGMRGIFNSNSTMHYAKSNGGNANGSFSFPAVKGEEVQVAAFVTRKGADSSVRLLVNGIRVDELSPINYPNEYIGGTLKYLGVWARTNPASYFEVEVKSLGILEDNALTAETDKYNASVEAKADNKEVTITGNGAGGKILSDFKMNIAENTTVKGLADGLEIPSGATYAIYADAESEEALGENDIIPEGAVLKTTSPNGFTKLSYAISTYDPMNMTWSSSGKDSDSPLCLTKPFGREQVDGETIVIRYKYNAYGANTTGSQLSGIMLNEDGTFNTLQGLFNSNGEKHYFKSANGNANGSISFPAVEGEEMQVAAFVTRTGNNSSIMLYVNGSRIDGLSGMNYSDAYIGGKWKYLGVWRKQNENSYFNAEVETLGVLGSDDLIAETDKYNASVAPKQGVTDIGVMGNGAGGLNFSALKLNYINDMTVGELKNKLEASEGASFDVYESAASIVPLEDGVIIPTGAVIKTESEKGFTTLTYALEKYNSAITFSEDADGNIVAEAESLFDLRNGKLYIAAYSDVSGTLHLEKIVAANANLGARAISAKLSKADAEGRLVKAFYWSNGLIPLAAATKE